MSTIPRFLLADNSDYPDDLFIIHTDFPRFILSVVTDEVEWLEEFEPDDEKELENQVQELLQEAYSFYDREILRSEE